MPNELYRGRVITHVKLALLEYGEAPRAEDNVFMGRIREIAARQLFQPLLPEGFRIKRSGKIIDTNNYQSREVDLIIYSESKLPTIMYGEEETYFPAEASFFAVEVKSTVTATELLDAHEKAKRITGKFKYSSGYFDEDDKQKEGVIIPVLPVLFGFSSDLAPTGKNEFSRYKEIAGEDVCCGLAAICIVGKGFWQRDKSGTWAFRPPTSEYDEVVDFLSTIINTLHHSDMKRGYPRLGTYLMKERSPEVLK